MELSDSSSVMAVWTSVERLEYGDDIFQVSLVTAEGKVWGVLYCIGTGPGRRGRQAWLV